MGNCFVCYLKKLKGEIVIKISVIVSIYNSQEWLDECLKSLTEQIFPDCEFICLDDGSVDDSYKIVNEYIKKDKRFKLIRQKNKGLAEARNVGIRCANGKYIAFLDGDDWLQDKEALEELYEVAKNDDLDFVTFDADCFYESDILRETSNRDNYYIRKKEYGLYSSGRELFCEMMENDDFCAGAWVLFTKREWIISNELWFVAGLNPEDCIWSFMCYMYAGKVRHIRKRFYRYRIRSNSLTTEKISFAVIYGRIYTVREILRYMLTNSLSYREEKEICKFIDIILWHMKDKSRNLQVSEVYKFNELSPVDSLLARYINFPALNLLKYNKLLYIEGFKHTLKNASGIIIYGAGKIGKLVYQYLKQERILENFHGFVVSKLICEDETLNGNKIRCICDGELIKTDLLLLAVSEQYQKEMVALAEENGFIKILSIDEYLAYALEEYYG